MATRIAHICWLPHPQTQRTAAIKRVQFLPTLYLVQVQNYRQLSRLEQGFISLKIVTLRVIK
jgi:hypothetical protein